MKPRPRKHRYRRVVAAVFGNAWAILPEKLEAIRELLDLRASGMAFTRSEIAARIGSSGARRSASQAPAGRIAVLNLFGTVAQRMSAMEQSSGGTSTESFGAVFDQALADESVIAIVLNVDSPGGAVRGTPELAAKIFAARGQKPIIAVANSLMASAALWIGSAADEIVATPSAAIGSIGVLAIHTDTSKADAKEGVKRTILTTAPYKAELYKPLTEEARARVQAELQTLHEMFVGAVAKHRGVTTAKVESDFGQGRTLLAAEALQAGLVDRIATLDQVLAELGAGSQVAGSQITAASSLAAASAVGASAPLFSLVSESHMDPQLLTALIRAGLISAASSPAEAQAALGAFCHARGLKADGPVAELVAALAAPAPVAAAPAPAPVPNPAPVAAIPAAPAVPAPTAPAAVATMGVEDIMAAVRLAPIGGDRQIALAQELVAQRASLSTSQILDRINREASQQNPPAGATIARVDVDARDKFVTAARDALLVRTFTAADGGGLPSQIFDGRSQQLVAWQPTSHGRDYGLSNLVGLATECLIHSGVPAHVARGLAPATIARVIMGADARSLGIYAGDGPAFNMSGMFSNILYDAQNVVLRRSYTEMNTTYQAWAGQDDSPPDFKNVHMTLLGEASDPRAIPENGEFEETSMSDARESYRLTVWGEVFSVSWETIVNDRLKAFTSVPMKQGRAMKRKQNKLVYQVLKDNAALGNDSIALFHASHSNLTTGSATPTVATFNTMYQKMSTQQGLNTDSAMLNLQPEFCLGPPALRGTILELLGSISNPAQAQGNAGVRNIWENKLTPVIDSELGAAASGGSDTAWYFASNYRDCETILYAFLQGLETPAFDQQVAFDRLGIRYRMYQAFATKAVDFRGLQKHAGV